MYTSFEITDFRCFDHLKVTDLARVNLIAGRNNSGKTALLEAVYLHGAAGNPEAIEVLKGIRGIQTRESDADTIWGSLFHQFDTRATAALVADTSCRAGVGKRGAPGVEGSSSVSLRELHDANELRELPMFRPLQEGEPDTTPSSLRRYRVLELLHVDTDGTKRKHHLLSPSIGHLVELGPQHARPVFLPARVGPPSDSEIAQFSAFAVEKRTREIVDALLVIEPRLNDLQVAGFGSGTTIHADIGLPRLVPLGLVGDGMWHLLSLVLSLSRASGGLVLVDEIENGFHYSILKDVWRVIGEAARRFDVQVFATTHSWECIQAAHEAFSETEEYDFRLHRLQRLQDRIGDIVYDQETLAAAIEIGMEVR